MKYIKTLFSPIVTLKYYSFKAYFAFTTFFSTKHISLAHIKIQESS